MPKLTDTQLVILSAAARRPDRAALPLPRSLKIKGAAATKTLDGLRRKGLLEERPAARGAAAWREVEDGRPMTLMITEAGLQATRLREARFGGRRKVGAEPDDEAAGQPAAAARPRPKRRAAAAKSKAKVRGRRAGRKAVTAAPKGKGMPATRAGTKQALLVNLLTRKRGASIEEAVEATGWRAHSVRGAISGALKRKLGLVITSEKVEGRGRVYRVAERG